MIVKVTVSVRKTMTETFRLTLKLIVIVRETLTEMLTDTVAKARNRDQDCNSVSKRDGDTKIYSDSTSESDIDSDTDIDSDSDRDIDVHRIIESDDG